MIISRYWFVAFVHINVSFLFSTTSRLIRSRYLIVVKSLAVVDVLDD